jgi:dsDNA-specific endonuclease/ATPase MutS2|tara:strand:- start:861 stop:1154 length:294 start_codon:yes stop_codon:yes gene_type:complete
LTYSVTDNEPDPIEFEISDELDLHTFRPAEVGELVPDYIELCLEKGITRVRIIHGKGIGTLRTTVHAILKRDPRVERFALAGPAEGGWGATVVRLKS